MSPPTAPIELHMGPSIYSDLQTVASRGPVVRVMLHGRVHAWLLTRPADIAIALRSPSLTSDNSYLSSEPGGSSVKFGFMGLDGPAHARLRRLAASAFTARTVLGLQPFIQQTLDDLVAEILPRGEADIVATIALPLPLKVICELLGVPLEHRDTFETMTNAVLQPGGTPAAQRRIHTARQALYSYLADLVEHAAKHPDDDLVSSLTRTEKATKQEIVEICALLLVAGYETTANAIATSVHALLTHPDQLETLRSSPDAAPQAVHELLRYCGPMAMGVTRYTRRQIVVAGTVIPAGQRVMLGLGAANHHEATFAEPDRLDTKRPNASAHFAFGRGTHYCIGAPLALLEMQHALTTITTRLPNLRLNGTPQWRPTIFYGIQNLPVAFDPGPSSGCEQPSSTGPMPANRERRDYGQERDYPVRCRL